MSYQAPIKFMYSKHALEQIQRRRLDREKVDAALFQPDKEITDETGLIVYHKIFQEKDKYYLYRVFVNYDKKPPLIVTVYKTSKIEKYED